VNSRHQPPHHALLFTLTALLLLAALPDARAQSSSDKPPPHPCETNPAWQQLDFWVGDWDVYMGETQVGTNRIEKILHGCALLENWADARGREGKSLFYYNSVTREWKQVWVTESGTMKEKTLVADYDGGGVRFQGNLPQQDGSVVLDRTTLTPLEDGSVRQLIEQSRDAGQTWTVGFDALYRPAPSVPTPH